MLNDLDPANKFAMGGLNMAFSQPTLLGRENPY